MADRPSQPAAEPNEVLFCPYRTATQWLLMPTPFAQMNIYQKENTEKAFGYNHINQKHREN
jgi:hypothetical protein